MYQVPTLASSYLKSGNFDIVIVGLGANDFATYFNSGYAEVYNGTVTPQQKFSKINTSMNTLFSALRNADADISIYVHLITVQAIDTFAAKNPSFPDATKRAKVKEAMLLVNDAINARPYGVIPVDFDPIFASPYIDLDQNGCWKMGEYNINFYSVGPDPRTNGLVAPASSPHFGILASCQVANFHLDVLNSALAKNIPLFSDNECLQIAGLQVSATTTQPSPTPVATVTTVPTNAPQCREDINQDGVVDLEDYSILVNQFFNEGTNLSADINQDQVVDLSDYSLLVAKFFQNC